MAWILPALGGIGSAVGGFLGMDAAADDRQQAKDAYNQSVNQYNAIGVPSVAGQQVSLDRYASAGQLDPQQMAAVKLGDSNMLGVSTDPQYRQAQLQALQQLQDIGQNGGMMLSDQAALEKIMGDIRASERGSREAILQDAAQRGGYGGGTALTAQLMNAQHAADLEHQAGLTQAGNAQSRALQAIQSAGQQAGAMQATDFSQKAQQAQAQDTIKAWNAQNQQGVNQYNTGLQNFGQQYNLENKQNIGNANVGLGNQEQMYNKGLQQQEFGNKLQLAQGAANARAGQANNAQTSANNTAQGWANIGAGVGQLGSGLGQYLNQGTQGQNPAGGVGAASKQTLDTWNKNVGTDGSGTGQKRYSLY